MCRLKMTFGKCMIPLLFILFNQKTSYVMRISDWSSDVCSSDLGEPADTRHAEHCLADGVVDEPGQRRLIHLRRGDRIDQHDVRAAAHCGDHRLTQIGRQVDRKSTRLNSSH